MSFEYTGRACFRGPHQFRSVVQLARTGPMAIAMEAAESLACWPASGIPGAPARPAAARAARVLDAAIDAAARDRQCEIARAAMRDQFDADPDRNLSDIYNRERLAIHLIERGARDTAEPDGEESTRITPDDLVDLVAEIVPIDDREDALWTAEQALRDYHTGWREPTPEEAAEAAEADSEVDAFLAVDHILAAMPADGDLGTALMGAYPNLRETAANKIAARALKRLALRPVRHLVGDTSLNPFAAEWREPGAESVALHEKAMAMIAARMMDEPAESDIAAKALMLERAARAAGELGVANALTRQRLGMEARPAPQGGINAADLMSMEFPEIRWVVPGFVTEGLTLLAGAPKIGKSWMALGLALAVAEGGKALGEIDCDAGPVLYLALEDNFRRLQSRLRLMGVKHGPTNLHFETSWPTVDEGCVTRLTQWLDNHAEARLIVVDVFAKIKSAKGGNRPQYDVDYKDVTALQRLALDRGIAIVLVHHTRKADADGDPFDLVSGTRGLTGSADSTFVLTRASGQVQPSLYGRGRDIEEIEKAMTFDPSTCRWSFAGPIVELQASPERQAILEVLKRAEGPMALADIAEAVQKSAANVNNMLGRMIEGGSVRKAATGQYEIAPPPARPWGPLTIPQ